MSLSRIRDLLNFISSDCCLTRSDEPFTASDIGRGQTTHGRIDGSLSQSALIFNFNTSTHLSDRSSSFKNHRWLSTLFSNTQHPFLPQRRCFLPFSTPRLPLAVSSMEALSNLVKSYLFRPPKVTRPQEPISSCPKTPSRVTLAGLPAELLLSIFGFLPLVDLICFSLCNHRLFELSRRQLNRLPRTQDDKISALNRVERDFPEYFACDLCKVLHRFDGSESFGLHELWYQRTCPLPCLHKDEWFFRDFSLRTHFDWTYSPYRLLFIQIKLVMKRF